VPSSFYLLIYAGVISLAVFGRTLLPLMFVGLPTLYGSWLMPIYGYTQHAGLAENVLDHRLNCRTVYMNRLHRYLGSEYNDSFLPKVEITVFVHDEDAPAVVKAIVANARTGRIGDGKILVTKCRPEIVDLDD